MVFNGRNKMTELRQQLNAWLESYAVRWNLQDKNILEIGIAGDEKPSGSHKYFGKGNRWTTLDKESKWKPDILVDITKNKIPDNTFDLVIMVQTLEHIWDYKKALSEIYRITKDKVIIDCPFMYEFHQDKLRPVDWQYSDDYWRFTPAAMNRLLEEVGFKKVDILFRQINTLCLAEKN